MSSNQQEIPLPATCSSWRLRGWACTSPGYHVSARPAACTSTAWMGGCLRGLHRRFFCSLFCLGVHSCLPLPPELLSVRTWLQCWLFIRAPPRCFAVPRSFAPPLPPSLRPSLLRPAPHSFAPPSRSDRCCGQPADRSASASVSVSSSSVARGPVSLASASDTEASLLQGIRWRVLDLSFCPDRMSSWKGLAQVAWVLFWFRSGRFLGLVVSGLCCL